MADQQVNEALEKLKQGTQKTKQMFQPQTIDLAQEHSAVRLSKYLSNS